MLLLIINILRMNSEMERIVDAKVELLFAKYDCNKNGVLSADELVQFFNEMLESMGNGRYMSEKEIHRAMAAERMEQLTRPLAANLFRRILARDHPKEMPVIQTQQRSRHHRRNGQINMI